MEEHNVVSEFEDTVKVILAKCENLLKSEIVKYDKCVFSQCDSFLNQKKYQSDLKESILENEKNAELTLNKEKELKKEMSRLHEDINVCKGKREGLEEKHEVLANVIIQQQAEIEELGKLLEERLDEAKSCRQDVIDKLALYQKFLGLEIRPLKNNRTQFIFSYTEDSSDFVFVIIQLIDRVYYVVDSDPKLHNFKELEDQLNKTNDLAAFVLLVRRQLLDKETDFRSD